MRRAGIVLALALLAGGCVNYSANRRSDIYDRVLTAQAEPGRVVAAELAFARAAQEKGQWTAFADYATADAVMFVPEVTNAHAFLKGRANPPAAVKWQPHDVWSSCDGSLAVTRGAWQRPDGSTGYFTTVWQRQNDGAYKWVMDQGDALEVPLAAPEFVRTAVSDCEGLPALPLMTPSPQGYQTLGGASLDKTLEWRMAVAPDASVRYLTVYQLRDGVLAPVLSLTVKEQR